ncbi:hypothetical protein PoB_002913900 [Plakobranchus ocellatus]|uniref:Uncharacterized protein n=1 Tax=Plakobranchus ocellatus TaxID=259542 RepID=A0AAV4A7Z2_9GAST|nr:hypothetical protein PoB_002913900 [Plakobranchus ocellatus]
MYCRTRETAASSVLSRLGKGRQHYLTTCNSTNRSHSNYDVTLVIQSVRLICCRTRYLKNKKKPANLTSYLYRIGAVASESALRSAGTILSEIRAPPPAPLPDGGPESLRSPCCDWL